MPPNNSQSHHQHENPYNPQTPKPTPNPKILSFFLKAIIMLLVISFFFLFLGIAALAVLRLLLPNSRFHRRSASACRGGISTDDIQIWVPGFRHMGESGLDQCTVCLDGFREGEMCRRLPGCCHVYHARCVDRWLVKVPNCPVCRTCVRVETEGRGLGSGDDESKVLWAPVRG